MNQKDINTEQNEDKKRQDGNTSENPTDNLMEEQPEISSHTEAGKNPEAGLEEELASAKDKLLRLYSEFDNFKKRTTREKMEFAKTASANTILALLPALDDFERALKSMTETKADATLMEGINLIYTKMKTTLEQQGLKEMKTAGGKFDPDLHDALSNVPVEDKNQKGKVVEEIQKGYYLNDVVIRHAKVIVGN